LPVFFPAFFLVVFLTTFLFFAVFLFGAAFLRAGFFLAAVFRWVVLFGAAFLRPDFAVPRWVLEDFFDVFFLAVIFSALSNLYKTRNYTYRAPRVKGFYRIFCQPPLNGSWRGWAAAFVPCATQAGSSYVVVGLAEPLDWIGGDPAWPSMFCDHRSVNPATDVELCG